MVPIREILSKVPRSTWVISLSLSNNRRSSLSPLNMLPSTLRNLLWLRFNTRSTLLRAKLPLRDIERFNKIINNFGNARWLQWTHLGTSVNSLWDKFMCVSLVKSVKCELSIFLIVLNDRSKYSSSFNPLNWFRCKTDTLLPCKSKYFNFFKGWKVSWLSPYMAPLVIDSFSKLFCSVLGSESLDSDSIEWLSMLSAFKSGMFC